MLKKFESVSLNQPSSRVGDIPPSTRPSPTHVYAYACLCDTDTQDAGTGSKAVERDGEETRSGRGCPP